MKFRLFLRSEKHVEESRFRAQNTAGVIGPVLAIVLKAKRSRKRDVSLIGSRKLVSELKSSLLGAFQEACTERGEAASSGRNDRCHGSGIVLNGEDRRQWMTPKWDGRKACR